MSEDRKTESPAIPAHPRRQYTPPVLEALGSWRALTLQLTSFTVESYLEDSRYGGPGSFV